MRLFIGILLFVVMISNNLWSASNIDPMTLSAKKQDILAKLIDKKAQLDKILSANNLTLSVKQEILLEQIETLISANSAESVTEVTGITQIKKGPFIKAALAFYEELVGLEDLLGTKKLDLYTISSDVLISELNKIHLYTPLGKHIMNSLLTKISTTKTVQEVAKAFRDIVRNDCGNHSFLKEHYTANKKAYQLKEGLEEEELEAIYKDDLLADFGKLKHLISSIKESINDANYGPNKEKKEKEELKKEKEELKKELDRKEFQKAIASWKAEQKKTCGTIISNDAQTDSLNRISKAAFFAILVEASKDWEIAQPSLAKELRVNIMFNIKDGSQTKDFVNAMGSALLNIKTPEDLIYKNWQKSKHLPSFDDLKRGIITSSHGMSSYNFIGEYVEWAAGVSGAVDSLKLPPNQQFETDKLLKKFKTLFSKKELSVFYPVFESKISKVGTKFPNIREVSQAWQASLHEVTVDSDSIPSLFHNLSEIETEGINGISDKLNICANLDTIKAAFLDSKRPKLSIKSLLAKGDTLNLTITLKDGTILTHTIFTEINEFKERAFASPTDISVTASNNKNGIEFSKKDVFIQSPIEHGTEGISSSFEFKIVFSKSKGSITTGNESGNEFSAESGNDKSKTDVDIKVTNNTFGVEGTLKSPKWIPKKFNPISYLIDGEISGQYARENGQEKGTEKTEGTFASASYTRTSNTSKQITKDEGIDTSFFIVKGQVYSSEFDRKGGTVKVDVNVLEEDITSPKINSVIPVELNMSREQIFYWKK